VLFLCITLGVLLTLGLEPTLGLFIIGLLPSLVLGGLGGKGDVTPGFGLSFTLFGVLGLGL
jgi:hypothetical protein